MPFHITTSTRAVAGSSTIYDDIKDTLFEVVMDKLWYQSNGMLYFAETLYSFTKLLVKYPLRGWITKVSKLLPYSTTAQKLRTSLASGVNYS